jgi:hypothetical protein
MSHAIQSVGVSEVMLKKIVMASALLSAGILVQACGSGSGSSSGVVTAATSTTGVGATTQNATLYDACNATYTENEYCEEAGVASTCSAVPNHVAQDGASTCEVTFTQNVSEEVGGIAAVEPSSGMGGSYGVAVANTGVYDTVLLNLTAQDVNNGGIFSGITDGWDCSEGNMNSVPNTSIWGYLMGSGYVQDGHSILSEEGGYLYVGLNESPTSGCMSISGSLQITRCVDSGGTPHPC